MIRKLADGGMAEIFLATLRGSQGFAKTVVLKRIHAAFLADEQFRNMLIDEAHISMSLSHNNIVQVLDLGQAGGRYFMALELVDGWDLGRLLQRAGAARIGLPAALALYIVAQVCRALDYAHSKTNAEGRALDIVHRDVSPQNVLISEQGEVKLADFGIAKARRKKEHTDNGVVKGKIAFMSPEQSLGLDLDARSDLYALGTLLYLLTTGRRPYEGHTDLEILLRVQKGQFSPPHAVKPDLHPTIAAIIMRAMAFDRESRYPSAHHMLVDVENVLRTSFGSPSQTELKGWLADLGRADREPPIGRATQVAARSGSASATPASSADLRLGNELELDDADVMDDDGGDAPFDGEEEATPARRNTRATASLGPGARAPIERVSGSDDTGIQDLRLSQSLITAEGSQAIRRSRSSGGSGWLIGLVALVVVGGAGFFLWRSAGQTEAVAPAAGGATPSAAGAKSTAASRSAFPNVRTLPAPPPKEEDVTIKGKPVVPAAPRAQADRAGDRDGVKWRRAEEIPALVDPLPPPPAPKPEPDPPAPPPKTDNPTPAPADKPDPGALPDIEDPFAAKPSPAPPARAEAPPAPAPAAAPPP